jgi:hypothetical protein
MQKYKHVLNASGRRHLLSALIAFGSVASSQAEQEQSAPIARWSFDSMEASGLEIAPQTGRHGPRRVLE